MRRKENFFYHYPTNRRRCDSKINLGLKGRDTYWRPNGDGSRGGAYPLEELQRGTLFGHCKPAPLEKITEARARRQIPFPINRFPKFTRCQIAGIIFFGCLTNLPSSLPIDTREISFRYPQQEWVGSTPQSERIYSPVK